MLTQAKRAVSMAGRAGIGQVKRARTAARLVIVGNGMASHKLCARLVASHSDAFKLVVFGEENRPAYDRVHLTRVLSGATPEQLELAPRTWYEQNGIELHLGDPVAAIDRDRRIVRTASGHESRYDTLILATGSRAFVPEIQGRDVSGVLVYRTIDDLQQIRARALYCRRAAVLGGGLLGLEAAKALRDLGLETWIVERGTSLLARQLGPEAGALLRAQVEKLGLHVCTQRETERIEAIGPDRLVQFNTGECLRVQLVVIAAGIRPRDELAVACGLQCGVRGGVQVNDFLQTSDPNILAIGECASHRGVCYGLATPAYRMADVLADHLLGKRRQFTGCEQSTRLKMDGIDVATFGEFQGDGETLQWRGRDGYRQLVLRNGRLLGASSVGEWPEAVRTQELIDRRARIWRRQRQRFLRSGRLWTSESALSVSEWPAAAVVCNCTGVKRGQLTAACAQGCCTVESLAERTGASTVCGSCAPLLAELVGAPVLPSHTAGLKTLGIVALAVLALASAFLIVKPVPFADSVQSPLRTVDALWRDSFWKQASGFTLVGLALVSMGLSLRKRVKRFNWGEFGHWRAVHAVLGGITLIVLVSHTGFRLGHNLNLVLMLNFLALAFAGAVAGAVTAVERRLSPRAAKRLRTFWTGTHIAIAWLLPVLVVFHALTAFYF